LAWRLSLVEAEEDMARTPMLDQPSRYHVRVDKNKKLGSELTDCTVMPHSINTDYKSWVSQCQSILILDLRLVTSRVKPCMGGVSC
jgi:hypothetical protein